MTSGPRNGKSGSSNIIDLSDVRARGSEAYVTGDKAKANLKVAGQIAAYRYTLRLACSKYPNPDVVFAAGMLRVRELSHGTGKNLWVCFRKVIDEVDREKIPSPDPGRIKVTTEGVQRGDGPIESFESLKK